jgi:hypothetical protein
VRTTRSFFGPHDIPPENFAAYGIVAFPQKATPATIRRHQSICEAFLATLPPVSASGAPISQQMVTVWPIDDASLAERLNKGSDAICSQAIEHYDLSTGLIALKEAQNQEHYSLSGQGPVSARLGTLFAKGQGGLNCIDCGSFGRDNARTISRLLPIVASRHRTKPAALAARLVGSGAFDCGA